MGRRDAGRRVGTQRAAHPARPAGCTGPLTAAPAACPAGGPPGRRWCTGRRPPSPACRPAGRRGGAGRGRRHGAACACARPAAQVSPVQIFCAGGGAELRCPPLGRCRARLAWQTKKETSAMCTPTSTSRRPPAPSSQRTLSASSTSVQFGGSMLRRVMAGRKCADYGLQVGWIAAKAWLFMPGKLDWQPQPLQRLRAAGATSSWAACSSPVPAHQVLWAAEVAPRRQLSRGDDITGTALHRRQLTQGALAAGQGQATAQGNDCVQFINVCHTNQCPHPSCPG